MASPSTAPLLLLLLLAAAAAAVAAAPPAALNLRPSNLSRVFSAAADSSSGDFAFLPGYTTRVTGTIGELGYQIQLINSSTGTPISAWHDLPLNLQTSNDGSATVNMLVEIPIGEQAKYETMTTTPNNPIEQDTWDTEDDQGNIVSRRPRYYLYGPAVINYGGLPQTWSSTNKTDPLTGYTGDNDPLDVIDIGSKRAPIAGAFTVKVLGALAMIDSNETDWKVITINTKDANASKYSDIKDVPQERLIEVLDFYANYKPAENKTAACFWPTNASATQPACKLTKQQITSQPLQYYHNKTVAVQVIKRYQVCYSWLLAGNDCESCKDLWYPGKAV